jgi:plasmid stabilization system protein ParE
MHPVTFLPRARDDFDNACEWYAERSNRAAARLRETVNDTLTKIADHPLLFAKIDDQHHEVSLRKFPFRLIYRVVDDEILVVALVHATRDPDSWKD